VSKADAGGDLEFFTRSVRFRVDGKQYQGVMTSTAWGELQKLWKIPTLAGMQGRLENIGFDDMPEIVWASLLKYHPKTTPEQGREISDAMGMGVANYVSQVCQAGMPPRGVSGPGPTKRARARKPR
jgi:hypothetical protein